MYHFHETRHCYSCRVLMELVEEAMNRSFRTEMDEGKIIFRHVNVDYLENTDQLTRFGQTSSSMMIGFL
ncbi:hypothetical protein [Methanospirillum sp.]|uniref:hypothetical protein n=1 Tax=Methanospirillum sp. TaxID=45200 RepID=UPI002D1FA345|nr:hypothetical protein [Methanospirillum sp.]